MALNKDILGQALYDATTSYNNTVFTPAELEAKRLAQWKAIAETIIDHFKNSAQINATVGVGLTASTFPVEGLSAVNIIE